MAKKLGILRTIAAFAAISMSCGGKSNNDDHPATSSGGATSGGSAATSGGTSGASAGGSSPTTGGFNTGGFKAASGGNAGTSGSVGMGSDSSQLRGGSSVGAASGNGEGCPGFAIALNANCESCRAPQATCRVEQAAADEECPSVYKCVERHCAFMGCSGAGCEEDACSCISPCLPEGTSGCREAWERWMACNKVNCESECSAPGP